MFENTRKKGAFGEDFAASFLESKGSRVLCRNYKGKHGEIDIIAEKGEYLLFVEVKLRKINGERPAQAVDSKKIRHILNTAEEFMCEYKDNDYISSMKPRIDVIELYENGGKIIRCEHIEDILTCF